MSCGCDCGSILVRPAVTPVSPLEIVAADDIIAGWDAAVRVDTAGAVSVLPDVSGNGFNLEQAVAGNQPTAVVGGGPNGNDSILFDGVNDYMTNTALNLPIASIQPCTYWGVFRHVTWTNVDCFWDDTVGGARQVLQLTATPSIEQYNGAPANPNGAFTLNTYMVFEAFFSASPSDAIRVGGTVSTGTSAGDGNLVGFTLGANGIPASFSNIELCELWLFGAALTIQQRSQLRAYATNRYGAIP